MAKRKKQKLTARTPNPKTKGRILRRAAFQITEIERDGEVSVDIEALDSQVRYSGIPAMFDNIFFMFKYHIEDQCDNLKDAIGNALRLRDKRGDEMAEVVGENITLKRKNERLESCIERIAKGIETGRITPFAASKELKEALKV